LSKFLENDLFEASPQAILLLDSGGGTLFCEEGAEASPFYK
jgi:PAS domain-containing protein